MNLKAKLTVNPETLQDLLQYRKRREDLTSREKVHFTYDLWEITKDYLEHKGLYGDFTIFINNYIKDETQRK